MRFLTLIALLLLSGGVFAQGNGSCDHPNFQVQGCTYPGDGGEQGPPGPAGPQGEQGEQGPPGPRGPAGRDGVDGQDGADGRDGVDGQDGRDGVDGKDGRDGIDGLNGRDGRDGVDGKDGVVPTDWINEVRTFNDKYSRYLAADQALQIYLPTERDATRVTFGMGRASGDTGVGLGVAYMNDDDVALTFGLAKSGSQTVGRVGLSLQFGGSKSRRNASNYVPLNSCTYVDGELRYRETCVPKSDD